MDGMWPPDLFDLFGFLKPSARNNSKRRGSQAKPGRAAGRNGKPPSGFVPVVDEDGIFVRVRLSPSTPRPSPAQVDALRARATELSQTFSRAFVEVWHKIPRPDRKDLLNYWRADPYPLHPDELSPPAHRPLICLADGRSTSAACERFGHELIFPAPLIEEHADRLPGEIIRVLAQVYRLATRAHDGLVLSMLEEPMDRWERRRGAKATDAGRDAKWAALEKAFLRRHDAETAQLLGRWGLEAAQRR